ncbi:hypothetical protein PMAYCL1PPCAC_23413 [Pristionchus mayeri]|uniref:BHLH domain-containing protein n=1 Tax=Pristionchus mayeri TaxID=1317129 RepID=A0AAN5I5P1_9BILA|nr:hypothetical protein PMAYCL1PPCAC_23413 [Pristionchus mayeri]
MPSKTPKQVSESKKIASRIKEKKRNVEINDAFSELQSSFTAIPFITKKKKVAKVKMLRLAVKYIRHLESILNDGYHQPSPYCPPRLVRLEDFETVAAEEFNERNTYTNRLHEDEEYYTLIKSRSSSSSLLHPLPNGDSPSSSSIHAPSLTPSTSPQFFPSMNMDHHH